MQASIQPLAAADWRSVIFMAVSDPSKKGSTIPVQHQPDLLGLMRNYAKDVSALAHDNT
jgi:hypothetical protein